MTVHIQIGDSATFSADLLSEQAPKAVAALEKLLPLDDEVVHCIWSGQAIRLRKPVPLGVPEFENRASILRPGGLYFAPQEDEFLICYGAAQARDQIGNETVSWIGTIQAGDLEPLAAVASVLTLTGAQKARLSGA